MHLAIVTCERCGDSFKPAWQPISNKWLCTDCIYIETGHTHVYRVVRVEEKDGQVTYHSACYHPAEWDTILIPGKKETRSGTALFAFAELKDALRYIAGLKDTEYEPVLQVWLASATNVHKAPERLPRHSTGYRAYWSGQDSTGEMFNVPQGTVLCNSITLLKRIV